MKSKIYGSFLLLLLIFQSCKSSKNIVDENSIKKETLKAVINQYNTTRPSFKTLRGRIKAYVVTKDIQQNINLSYRIEKENTIWLSAKFAGLLEIAKIMMTPENIQFYERISNKYFTGDFSLVSEFLGLELSYFEIENLLLSKNIKTLGIDNTDIAVNDDTFTLNSVYENGLKQEVILDKKTFNVLSQLLVLKDQQLKIDYELYQIIDNKYFPEKLSIYANNKEEAVNIILDYKTIKLNDELKFPFNIPSNFSPLKLN